MLSRDNNYVTGECVTLILPGKVCPLEAVATRCDANLTATACECDPGFHHRGSSCVGELKL